MGNNQQLFHYTDINALKSIFENNSIWLTHIRFMNDKDELSRGLDKIYGFSDEHFKSKSLLSPLSKSYRLEGTENFIKRQNIYITSFCSNSGDQLSQWRAYGNYSLEFDLSKLKTTCEIINSGDSCRHPEIQECVVEECSYDESSNIIEAKKIGTEVGEELLLSSRPSNNFGHDLTYPRTASNKALNLAYRWKDIGFKEESEVRLVARVTPSFKAKSIKYRSKFGLLVPYYDFAFPAPLIKSITIGPHPDQNLAKDSLEMFLDTLTNTSPEWKGIDSPPIYLSSIPYKPR